MNHKKHGFTIVEISLVLAIAALIFLMAFIALPSLWASERDADRKSKVMEFVGDIKTYQTNNNRGALPTIGTNKIEFKTSDPRRDDIGSWYDFVKDYVEVGGDFTDPDGTNFTYAIAKCKSESGEARTGEPCLNDPFRSVNQEVADLNGGIDYKIYLAIGATCDGDQLVKTNNARNFAAMILLERSGRYCYNS